jgi:hypothetical protein
MYRYTQEELKYFPLNTALFDPPKKVDASAEQEVEDDDDDSQVDDKVKSTQYLLVYPPFLKCEEVVCCLWI